MNELQDKQEYLKTLEAFVASRAYRGYLESCDEDIRVTREAIVDIDPITREHVMEEFKLRGELRHCYAMLRIFEDARVTLKNRIDILVEEELKNATSTKI